MGSFIIKLCLVVLVCSLVVGSGICRVCECETCHDYVVKWVPQCCSMEKKFVLGMIKVSWFQALENCAMAGYKLASITSQKETDNLLEYIKEEGVENEWYWLGGSDLHKEGEFVWWMSLDTPFANYTNWAPGVEPNDENNCEDCVNIWAKGTWNDQNCYDNLYYVCEYHSPLNC